MILEAAFGKGAFEKMNKITFRCFDLGGGELETHLFFSDFFYGQRRSQTDSFNQFFLNILVKLKFTIC
jgi:hypothetical protein